MRPFLLVLLAVGIVAADDMDAELAALVDLPTSKQRAARARELAKDKERTVDMWLAAMRRFAPSPEGRARTGSFGATAGRCLTVRWTERR